LDTTTVYLSGLSALFSFLTLPSSTEISTLSYTTLFRSLDVLAVELGRAVPRARRHVGVAEEGDVAHRFAVEGVHQRLTDALVLRSEEHTSELQSRENLVCRLLLEKKKNLT